MKNQLGFSLIELLIAITIASVISLVVAQGLFSTSRGSVKVEVRNTLKQSGDFTLSTIEKFVREARSVDCDHTAQAPGEIKLVNKDYQETTFKCQFDNGITRIASVSASGTVSFLSPTNVSIGGSESCTDQQMSLRFTCTAEPALPTQVGIQFRLSQKGTPYNQFEQSSITFGTSVNVRN